MSNTELLTDQSLMPYGKHKGKKMIEVPADYLIWLYDNEKCSPSVLKYVEYNLNALQKEMYKSDKK